MGSWTNGLTTLVMTFAKIYAHMLRASARVGLVKEHHYCYKCAISMQ
jgi:hypothetical protein